MTDDVNEPNEQEASKTSLFKKKCCKIEAAGISSSFWWLKPDFLAHNFTPPPPQTNHSAHRYLLQSTNKRQQKSVAYSIIVNRKVTLDGLKMSTSKIHVCSWSLTKLSSLLTWGGLSHEATSRHTVSGSPVAFDWLLLLNLLIDWAVDGPAVIAVCCSCQCCLSMSAAAAGGAERLSG